MILDLDAGATRVAVVGTDRAARSPVVDALIAEHYVCRGFGLDDRTVVDVVDWAPAVVLLCSSGFDDGVLLACRELRDRCRVPVLVATPPMTDSDVVACFEAGADGVVPSGLRGVAELIARMRAVLRRGQRAERPSTSFGSFGGRLRLDADRRVLIADGDEVALSRKEYLILALLLEEQGRVVSRRTLRTRIWGPQPSVESKTLDAHVRRLREKIEDDPSRPRHLRTVRGVGFLLEAEPGVAHVDLTEVSVS